MKLADDLFGVGKSNSLGGLGHIGFDVFVRSNDSGLVHGIERNFHVRQKVLNVLDHAEPDLRPEEVRGGASIAVPHLDFHFKISRLAPHEGCFDAPKWFNVMVDLIEKLFYNGCIVGLSKLEPFVETRGRVAASALAVCLSCGFDCFCLLGEEGIEFGMSIEYQAVNRVWIVPMRKPCQQNQRESEKGKNGLARVANVSCESYIPFVWLVCRESTRATRALQVLDVDLVCVLVKRV